MNITLIAKLEDVNAAFKINIIIAMILNKPADEEAPEINF